LSPAYGAASAAPSPKRWPSANLEAHSDVERAVIARGRRFTGHRCDLADRHAVEQVIADIRAAHPVLDVLVNNAGTIRRSPALEHPQAWWDEVLEVNLSAQFALARGFGETMLEAGRGKVVFVASLLSFQGGINVPAYAASKGGVAQLTKALANEWAARGVNVNAVAPGYVDTDNTAPLRADPDRSAAILARIPAGRWASAAEIADPVVFLASDAARYVHGTVLAVDGGWLGR